MDQNNFRSGFVTLVGRPNVGKSTILNSFAGEKVAITSPKPQTTRNNMRGIVSSEDYQIIFIDTPGIHNPKNKLGEFMVKSAESTFSEVDVIVFVLDGEEKDILPGDYKILDSLKEVKVPVILAINKIDAVAKESLLGKIAALSEYFKFKACIPVSALDKDGTDLLLKEIVSLLPFGPKYFPEDIITDSTLREISREIIREKILLFTNEEVPHGVGIEIIQFKEPANSRGVTVIEANIYCEKQSHKGILIGKEGAMLKKIGMYARKDIEKILGGRVNLKLWIKIKKDWRNNPGMLKELGFVEE